MRKPPVKFAKDGGNAYKPPNLHKLLWVMKMKADTRRILAYVISIAVALAVVAAIVYEVRNSPSDDHVQHL